MTRGPSHPTVAIKLDVIERDGGFCLLALDRCQGEATTTDHRANRGQGGSRVLNHAANLVAACAICNGDKADASEFTRFDLRERGLLVTPGATHAKTLARAVATPVMDLAGNYWMLESSTIRREATDVEIAKHLMGLAA